MRIKRSPRLSLGSDAGRMRKDEAARWLLENDPKIWKAERNLLRRQKRRKRLKTVGALCPGNSRA